MVTAFFYLGVFGWFLLLALVVGRDDLRDSRRRAAASRSHAGLARHQVRRNLQAEMVNHQIRRNGDRIRREIRAEMERFDA